VRKFHAIVGLAAMMTLAGPVAAAPAATAPAVTISELAPDRFELVYSAAKFTSRDEVERELLLQAARLSLAHGAATFVLLSMPGEQPDVHPPRRAVSYGSAYGHWQPHWNYLVAGQGWQPWHPEWGARFWSEEVDLKTVEQVNAHAMISLDPPAERRDGTQMFDARAVIGDLTRPVRPPDHSAHHQR
jgi:hypothetical protein